jgi:uncharacterized repeat protein (TIGR03847 family)
MSREMYDFGQVTLLDAEAIGRPGQRRFRIYARGPAGSASLWMEREQLEQLLIAINQVLAQISGGEFLHLEAGGQAQVLEPVPGAPADFPENPDLEFRVGQMTLGYEERRDLLLLMVASLRLMREEGEAGEEEEELGEEAEEVVCSFLFTRAQAEMLSRHIVAILAAGRPRCPFCGLPMEPGPHVCAKQNGHYPIIEAE